MKQLKHLKIKITCVGLWKKKYMPTCPNYFSYQLYIYIRDSRNTNCTDRATNLTSNTHKAPPSHYAMLNAIAIMYVT